MCEQDYMDAREFVIGLCVVGATFGFFASSGFVLALFLGANYSLWLIVPVFLVSGTLSMIAVVAVLLVRQNRETRRSPIELNKGLGGPDESARDISSFPERQGGIDRLRSGFGSGRSGVCDQHDAAASRAAQLSPWRSTRAGGDQPGAKRRSAPELDVIDGGVTSRAAGVPTGFPSVARSSGASPDGVSPRAGEEYGRARMLPLSEAVVDRLFGRLVELRPEWVLGPYGVVGYLGQADTNSLRAIASWAGPESEVVFASSMDETSWREVEGLLHRAGVFFVDADFMGDVGETVDLCLRLRNCSPATPLILISSEVRDHDLTAERAAICDATLKTPLTARNIQMGISAAHRNASRLVSASDPVKPSRRQQSSSSSRTVSPRRRGRASHLHQL